MLVGICLDFIGYYFLSSIIILYVGEGCSGQRGIFKVQFSSPFHMLVGICLDFIGYYLFLRYYITISLFKVHHLDCTLLGIYLLSSIIILKVQFTERKTRQQFA